MGLTSDIVCTETCGEDVLRTGGKAVSFFGRSAFIYIKYMYIYNIEIVEFFLVGAFSSASLCMPFRFRARRSSRRRLSASFAFGMKRHLG